MVIYTIAAYRQNVDCCKSFITIFFLFLLFSMCNGAVNWCDKLCFFAFMLSNGNCTQIFLSRMSWMKQNLTDAVEKRRKIKPKPPVIWHILCSARYMLSTVRLSVTLCPRANVTIESL